ncbi:hypothetical protein [Streptomyces sp. NPDC092307]|uniref:hypothetical protein n=1 Tax=Streptomyces sp. NPDC092307 TaxID=3366013 RepID=UPI0038218DD5
MDHIVEVDPSAMNLDQIRKLIRQWITPAPRGVRVGWSGGDGERVAFIEIPAQAVDTLFVVPAPEGKPGAPRTDTVAVPMRDGDSTHWLPRTAIQQLLSAGVRASGMPTAQALTELVRQAMSEAGPNGGLRVGQGLPDREREMRTAYTSSWPKQGREGRPACTGPGAPRGHRPSPPARGHGHPLGDRGRLTERGRRRRIVGRGPPDVFGARRVAVAAAPPLQPEPGPVGRELDGRADASAAPAGAGEPALGRGGPAGDQQVPAHAA